GALPAAAERLDADARNGGRARRGGHPAAAGMAGGRRRGGAAGAGPGRAVVARHAAGGGGGRGGGRLRPTAGPHPLRPAVRGAAGGVRGAGRARARRPVMRYLPRVLGYLKPNWRLAAFSVALILLGALFSLLMPWPLKFLVDNVLQNQPLP